MSLRNPLAGRVLAWSAIVWTTVALASCLVAFVVAGTSGLGSAAVASATGLVFPLLTSAAIVLPDGRYGRRGFAARAFASFLGGFVVKVAAFVVAMLVLLPVDRILPGAVYGSLAAIAIASLVVDVIVANGIRPRDE